MKKYIMLAAIAFSICFLGGCNTLSGVGKDVKSAGEAIEETAEDNKQPDEQPPFLNMRRCDIFIFEWMKGKGKHTNPTVKELL